jgi:hypothetical protein
MEARDVSIAMKTSLTEAYVNGWVNKDVFTNGMTDFFEDPHLPIPETDWKSKLFAIHALHPDYSQPSWYEFCNAFLLEDDDGNLYYPSILNKTGEKYYVPLSGVYGKGMMYYFFAKKGSDATALSADGFAFFLWPEGGRGESASPVILVTYKIKPLTEGDLAHFYDDSNGDGAVIQYDLLPYMAYDSSAGYEVYHLEP